MGELLHGKQSQIHKENEGDESGGANVLAMRLCKRHSKPMRKGQRNCHVCNVEANKKYRQSVRMAKIAMLEMAKRIAGSR